MVSHSFRLSAGTPAFMGQLFNFSKNVAICGGLLFIGATVEQPAWVRSVAARVTVQIPAGDSGRAYRAGDDAGLQFYGPRLGPKRPGSHNSPGGGCELRVASTESQE